MAGRLEGKVAIVMGAGSSQGGLSMGNTTAALFAREGAKVFAVDIGRDKMSETASMIEEHGGEYQLHECDVADDAGVKAMTGACFAKWGRLDILFNNVGVQSVGGPLDLAEENLDRLLQVNVKGMFYTCRAALPYMLQNGSGSIINNASIGALRYSYPCAGYMASKGAVISLSTGIGLQYAPQGIRCNVVLPGYMHSERMVERFKREMGDRWEEEIERRKRAVPSHRLGEPWDIAHAVTFLASDEARYINGVALPVDGGISMATPQFVQ